MRELHDELRRRDQQAASVAQIADAEARHAELLAQRDDLRQQLQVPWRCANEPRRAMPAVTSCLPTLSSPRALPPFERQSRWHLPPQESESPPAALADEVEELRQRLLDSQAAHATLEQQLKEEARARRGARAWGMGMRMRMGVGHGWLCVQLWITAEADGAQGGLLRLWDPQDQPPLRRRRRIATYVHAESARGRPSAAPPGGCWRERRHASLLHRDGHVCLPTAAGGMEWNGRLVRLRR